MNNIKFLILGCNGMAGHTISLYLKEKGYNVIGFDRRKSLYVDSIVGDAQNLELIKNLILKENFDTIVNCIGVLNQAAEDNQSLAIYLNSFFPHYLADLTKNTKTQIIHMSTDCVFSGKKGNYTEHDFKDGITFYDRTKALGELEDEKNLTLRNSIIGPDINSNGIGLLNWFLKQNSNVNGYKNNMWTGVTTLELAKIIEKAAIQKAHGLINNVPDHSISKYDLLILFNKYLRNKKIEIIPYNSTYVDKSLVRTNFTYNYTIPNYEDMIKELSIWMKEHKNMYPHYIY